MAICGIRHLCLCSVLFVYDKCRQQQIVFLLPTYCLACKVARLNISSQWFRTFKSIRETTPFSLCPIWGYYTRLVYSFWCFSADSGFPLCQYVLDCFFSEHHLVQGPNLHYQTCSGCILHHSYSTLASAKDHYILALGGWQSGTLDA